MIVLATVAILGVRRATEFSTPQHEGIVQQSARFQVVEQTRNRLVTCDTKIPQAASDLRVVVPALQRDLDEPNTRFGKSSGQ